VTDRQIYDGNNSIKGNLCKFVNQIINPLKGRAVKCYTLPSSCNLHFNFWHSGTQALSPERL